jgi:hypothetical protein
MTRLETAPAEFIDAAGITAASDPCVTNGEKAVEALVM